MGRLILVFLLLYIVGCAPVSMRWVNMDPTANLQRDMAECKRDWIVTPADDSNAVWVDRAMRDRSFNKCMQARGWKWGSSGNP